MRFTKIMLFILTLLITSAGVTFAQIDVKNNAVVKDNIGSLTVNISGKLTAQDTLTSAEFTLPGEYDGVSWSTYPPTLGVQLTGTSTATRKVSTYLLGSNFKDGTFQPIDTLLYKDSTNIEINKTFNANGKKYIRWKLLIIGDAGNNNTTFKQVLYYNRRE